MGMAHRGSTTFEEELCQRDPSPVCAEAALHFTIFWRLFVTIRRLDVTLASLVLCNTRDAGKYAWLK